MRQFKRFHHKLILLLATNFSVVFDFFPSFAIVPDGKEFFLKVKYRLQLNISLSLPQGILPAGKEKMLQKTFKFNSLTIFLNDLFK